MLIKSKSSCAALGRVRLTRLAGPPQRTLVDASAAHQHLLDPRCGVSPTAAHALHYVSIVCDAGICINITDSLLRIVPSAREICSGPGTLDRDPDPISFIAWWPCISFGPLMFYEQNRYFPVAPLYQGSELIRTAAIVVHYLAGYSNSCTATLVGASAFKCFVTAHSAPDSSYGLSALLCK